MGVCDLFDGISGGCCIDALAPVCLLGGGGGGGVSPRCDLSSLMFSAPTFDGKADGSYGGGSLLVGLLVADDERSLGA